MEVLHEERGNIIASLLPSELSIRITIQLVRRVTEVNNTKEIDCQGGEIIDLSGLLAAIIWQRHVLRIVTNKYILTVLVRQELSVAAWT
jgi:hypothetical protein